MAPFTKAEMMEEFREIVFQVARAASFSFRPEAAHNLLFNEVATGMEESRDIYCPELTAKSFHRQFDLEQIAASKAVEQFYDYGLLGIRNMLPLEDGGANEWTFAYGLIRDAANSFLIADINNGEYVTTTKCLLAARAYFARHILDGQTRTMLPGDEEDAPEDMLTIQEVATLAGLDERTVRNATNRNAVNRLDTAIVKSNIYIPRESAQTWLSTKRGFTPSRVGESLPKNVVLNDAFSGISEACDYLRSTRENMGLSQSELLAKAKLNHDTNWLNKIESGLITATAEDLKAIGNALELNGQLFALRMNEAAYKTNMFAIQGEIYRAMSNKSEISEPETINHAQIEDSAKVESNSSH